MATSVDELLDQLYEMIDEARNVPLKGEMCMLDRDRALDILDDVRAKFPVEFAEARKLLASRNDYLAAAKRDAELIRKQAEEQARQMVGENELMSQAKQKSGQLMRQAEEQSRELRRAANEYCDDLLRRTEEAVAEAGRELARSRAAFRAAAGATSPKPSFDVAMDGDGPRA